MPYPFAAIDFRFALAGTIYHAVLTACLFAASGCVIAGRLMGMHHRIGADILPFFGLVAAAAVVNAAAGHWLDGWGTRRSARAR